MATESDIAKPRISNGEIIFLFIIGVLALLFSWANYDPHLGLNGTGRVFFWVGLFNLIFSMGYRIAAPLEKRLIDIEAAIKYGNAHTRAGSNFAETPPQSQFSDGHIEELRKLAELHASGFISDEEFKKLRARLMDSATQRG